ncbi:MAG: F0F1 ATP synthase subunit A [Pseudomonadota bacterium]
MGKSYTFFEAFLPGVTEENLHVVTATFVVLFLFVASFLIYPKLRDAKKNVLPEKKFSLRTVFEVLIEMIAGLCDDIIGHGGRKYLPFTGSIFFFIFFSNLIGLVPGFLPPTDNWVTGAAVATISFIAFNYFGFRENGIGYLKHFFAPVSPGPMKGVVLWVVIMIPMIAFQAMFLGIELLSTAFRPITLSVRLFANMFADHTVLGIFSGLVPYLVPVPFLVLGIFVSFVQAFIFTLLTTVYISGAVAQEH